MMNIMKRAWEIAREASAKFGGKASEYISEALKMAWAESKDTRIQFGRYARLVDVQDGWRLSFSRWEKYGKKRIYINEIKGADNQKEFSTGYYIDIETGKMSRENRYTGFNITVKAFLATYKF